MIFERGLFHTKAGRVHGVGGATRGVGGPRRWMGWLGLLPAAARQTSKQTRELPLLFYDLLLRLQCCIHRSGQTKST